MANIVSIKKFELQDNYLIRFVFSDGKEKLIDFARFIKKDSALSGKLARMKYFRKIELYENGNGIYWPNGYDFCPEYLRFHVHEVNKQPD